MKPEDKGFFPLYDKDCQKIRSIKGKESNYFKLLQDCCDTFDCWIEPIIDCDKETGKINLGNISNTTKGVKGIIQFQVIQNTVKSILIKIELS